VVTAGIALYAGIVGVAEVTAGDVAASRENKGGGVDEGLGEYMPPTLWVAYPALCVRKDTLSVGYPTADPEPYSFAPAAYSSSRRRRSSRFGIGGAAKRGISDPVPKHWAMM
jgi:hypothetical protein